MFEEAQKELAQTIESIQKKYQPQLDQLKRDGDVLKGDVDKPSEVGAVIGVDVKIEWKDHKIAFEVPTVSMRNRGFSYHLPVLRMVTRKIAFDVPVTVMVDEVVGYYPEVSWRGVKWKPIIISRPKIEMRRKEIHYDLPEIRMERQEFVLKIPEFEMHRIEWIYSVPEFTIINVSQKADEWTARGKDLQARGEAIAAAMKAEIDAAVASFQARVGGGNIDDGNAVRKSFDDAIQAVTKSIADLVAQGIDPIKVPGEGGDVNLRKVLADLIRQRDEFDAQFGEGSKLLAA